MASISIGRLDDDVKTQLRARAAGNGRSLEEEARLILREAVGREAKPKKLWLPSSTNVSRHIVAWNWNCRLARRCASRRASTEAAAMLVLNTNVLSELVRSRPEAADASWVARCTTSCLHATCDQRGGTALWPCHIAAGQATRRTGDRTGTDAPYRLREPNSVRQRRSVCLCGNRRVLCFPRIACAASRSLVTVCSESLQVP